MRPSIEPTLYIDIQAVIPSRRCPDCGSERYAPGYHCPRCERRLP